MRYVLSKDTPPTLVMLVGTRTGEKIVMVSAFVIAPVLLLVSTGTLLSEDWDLGLCVGGFGCFLLCVAILMARVPPPPRLLFDLGAQTLRVDELSPSPRAETIPLGDFLGFAVVPTIQSQQTVYEVVLVRRDGAAWRLDVRHRKDQAEAFCAELARRVPLDALPVKATDLRELQLGAGQAIEPFSLQEREEWALNLWLAMTPFTSPCPASRSMLPPPLDPPRSRGMIPGSPGRPDPAPRRSPCSS